MSTAKHTAGPWIAHGNSVLVSDSETRTVCECAFMAILPDESRANAQLISAAPELLAACKALLKVVSAMGIGAKLDLWPWSEEDGTVRIGAGEAMAKAIAKAEGKA